MYIDVNFEPFVDYSEAETFHTNLTSENAQKFYQAVFFFLFSFSFV